MASMTVPKGLQEQWAHTKLNSTVYSASNRIDTSDFLSFRCILDDSLASPALTMASSDDANATVSSLLATALPPALAVPAARRGAPSLLLDATARTVVRADAQRVFTGAFYPRFRALYLEEVRELSGGEGLTAGPTRVRLFPAYPFDEYVKQDGKHFAVADFVVGQTVSLGAPTNQRDHKVRTFRIVEVDTSNLRTTC